MKGIFFFILIFSSLSAKAACEGAVYDEHGITHQKVTSEKDYYYCFGFHHGSDRAWQMDFFRRLALGKNAEVLGMNHIKSDFMMRLLNIPALAQRLYQELTDDKKQILDWYAEGVNQGFETGKRAQEFLDLDFTPEKWLPEHSLFVMLLQSFDQTKKTFFFDVKEEEKLQIYPDAKDLSRESTLPWFTSILKEGEYLKTSKKEVVEHSSSQAAPKLWAPFPEVFGKESGSNNWVISAKSTENKKAILANDPHLDLKTPLFWYWIHLEGHEQNVIGASLPGLPFIASGTNGLVSWGLTNGYMNSADSVSITDLSDSDVITSLPVIWFKFGFLKLPFFFKTLSFYKETYPKLPLDVPGKENVFLRWSGHILKAQDITAMFEVHKTRNVQEMDHVLARVGIPSWNFVFADVNGDIGYRMVGNTYEAVSEPYGVQKMTAKEFENPKMLDKNQRPQALKPKRDFIVTANNQHWPHDSYFKGGSAYSMSFRAKTIEDHLIKTKKHTMDMQKKIQCDVTATDARFLVPLIQKVFPEFLRQWDFNVSDESREIGLYRRLVDLLMETWKVDEAGLYRLLSDLREDKRKDLLELYNLAFAQTDNRPWKELIELPFEHLSGEKNFVYSPVLAGIGDKQTVNPGTARWDEKKKKYIHFSGASMRMIIEMGQPVKILLNLPGKNRDYQTLSSGNQTPWHQWRACEYFEVAF